MNGPETQIEKHNYGLTDFLIFLFYKVLEPHEEDDALSLKLSIFILQLWLQNNLEHVSWLGNW